MFAGFCLAAFGDDLNAQVDTTYCNTDGRTYTGRRVLSATAFVGVNSALLAYEKKAWWSGKKADHFFFHADWDQDFRDQDKFGHMFGGYFLTKGGDALLRSACVSKPKAIALAATYAMLFQLQMEIWDGRFEKYGFSYADLVANTTGMSLAVLQYKYPRLVAIKPTVSYWPTKALRNGGGTEDFRASLDYSGQTYWLSTDVESILSDEAKKHWPGVVRFSIGHSITDWVDPVTGGTQRAQRKILLSLDLDADKIPGNNPVWKRVKHTLSYIRFPAPALQLTPELKLIGIYK